MYKWDTKKIKKQYKELNKLLRSPYGFSETDLKKVNLTSFTYYLMLKDNNRITYNFTANGHNIIKNKKVFLFRKRLNKVLVSFFNSLTNDLSNEYQEFLLQIINNLNNQSSKYVDETKLKLTNEEIVAIASDFFKSLEDPEITNLSQKILNKNNNLIQFVPKEEYDDSNSSGICYYNFIQNNAYYLITRNDTIMDLFVLVHEVGHGIHFILNPKFTNNKYYGFGEILPYTFELLLLDYLKENNLFENYINDRELYQTVYPIILAKLAIYSLTSKGNSNDKEKKLDYSTIKKLTTIKSYLIAKMLAEQYKEDKTNGMKTIKTLIKTPFLENETPNFEFLNISNEDILEKSLNYYHSKNKSL